MTEEQLRDKFAIEIVCAWVRTKPTMPLNADYDKENKNVAKRAYQLAEALIKEKQNYGTGNK